MKKNCFQCGQVGKDLYGYVICDDCKAELRLFSDETIKKYVDEYEASDKSGSYAEEVAGRLNYIENKYIKSRIKLLDIQERLNELS